MDLLHELNDPVELTLTRAILNVKHFLNSNMMLKIEIREDFPRQCTEPPYFTQHVNYSALISSSEGSCKFPLGSSTLYSESDEIHVLGQKNCEEVLLRVFMLTHFLERRNQPYYLNFASAPSMESLLSISAGEN